MEEPEQFDPQVHNKNVLMFIEPFVQVERILEVFRFIVIQILTGHKKM